MISIAGLDKADVLRVLYDSARVQGAWGAFEKPGDMTKAEAAAELKKGPYFDYVHGRVMRVQIDDTGELDPTLYDRDNGAGAAERAISVLRK